MQVRKHTCDASFAESISMYLISEQSITNAFIFISYSCFCKIQGSSAFAIYTHPIIFLLNENENFEQVALHCKRRALIFISSNRLSHDDIHTQDQENIIYSPRTKQSSSSSSSFDCKQFRFTATQAKLN